MARQIIGDHDIAGRERRPRELLDPGTDGRAVDRTIQHQRHHNPIVALSGEEGGGVPMTMRHRRDKAFSTRRPFPRPGRVGFDPDFIEDDQPRGIKPRLRFSPVAARFSDVGARLVSGIEGIFECEAQTDQRGLHQPHADRNAVRLTQPGTQFNQGSAVTKAHMLRDGVMEICQ